MGRPIENPQFPVKGKRAARFFVFSSRPQPTTHETEDKQRKDIDTGPVLVQLGYRLKIIPGIHRVLSEIRPIDTVPVAAEVRF